jgi:hypothetical protein
MPFRRSRELARTDDGVLLLSGLRDARNISMHVTPALLPKNENVRTMVQNFMEMLLSTLPQQRSR